MANTAPAAPRTIVDVSANVQSELAFWFYANQIGPRIWNFLTPQDGGKRQENQAERDARVARIKIFPGDVTVEEGQQVHFAALAYDSQDDSVSGVKFTWTAHDEDRGRKVTIASPGRSTQSSPVCLLGHEWLRRHEQPDPPGEHSHDSVSHEEQRR